MANLRIIYNNVGDKATLSASSTAGSLVVDNLKTNTKSQVWRATSTSATLTVDWVSPEQVGAVALPFCNLTSTATIRVRGYLDSVEVMDTGVVLACAYAPFGLWTWGDQELGVNAFSYGGAAYGRVWFLTEVVDSLVVDLVDTDNAAGYIEFSRLVTGTYWSPILQPQYGVDLTTEDNSEHYRTDAGDLLTDAGTRNRKIQLEVSNMEPSERSRLWKILQQSGMTNPLFISLFPENDDDPELEQSYQIYGKLSSTSAVTAQYYNRFSAPIELEEI